MAVGAVAEDDDIARNQPSVIYISRTRADLFDFALVCQLVQRRLPCDYRLRIHAGGVDGVGDELCIGALDMGQVITNEVGHKAGAAEAVLLKACNVRRFAGDGGSVGHRFPAGGCYAVVDVRKDIRRVSRQCAAVVSGLIERSVVLLLLHIVASIGKGADDDVVHHTVGDIRGGCGEGRCRQCAQRQHESQKQSEKSVFSVHG